MISETDSVLEKAKIFLELQPKVKEAISNNFLVYDTIDSTNVEAKRLLKESKISSHGAVILAEHQSAGKGRLGRSFYSPKNKGIYISVLYGGSEFLKRHNDSVAITVSAAVAVRRALAEFGVFTKIKWVNDLFLKNKKVCGILVEGVFSTLEKGTTGVDSYIIGIGVNVFEDEDGFPDELKAIAGSIGKGVDRNVLVASIINNLFFVLTQTPMSVIDEYREHSLVLNKKVTVITPNEKYSAKVIAITDEAHLTVERDNGATETLLSGEISLRL